MVYFLNHQRKAKNLVAFCTCRQCYKQGGYIWWNQKLNEMEASFSKILVICRFACSCCSRAAFFRSSSWWSSWLFQRRNEEVICKSLLQRRFSIQLARWDPYCNEIWQADLELLYCMFELFFCSSVKYVWFSFESKHIKQQPLQESSLILDTDIMLSLMTWAPGSWWHLLKQGYGSLHPLMTPFIVSRYTT